MSHLLSQVTDAFDTIVEKTTSQVSCQYPIVEITDLTASLGKNKATNAWSVINEFPTVEEVEQDEVRDSCQSNLQNLHE